MRSFPPLAPFEENILYRELYMYSEQKVETGFVLTGKEGILPLRNRWAAKSQDVNNMNLAGWAITTCASAATAIVSTLPSMNTTASQSCGNRHPSLLGHGKTRQWWFRSLARTVYRVSSRAWRFRTLSAALSNILTTFTHYIDP